MTLQELKSRAYDLIVHLELCQAELRQVNQQIKDFKPEEVKPDGTA